MMNFRTKRDNYLLRSKRSDSLIKTMMHACDDKGVISALAGRAFMVNSFGHQAGDCSWEVGQLVRRGLLRPATTERYTYFEPTEAGLSALYAARFIQLERAWLLGPGLSYQQ
jgi:hypothetical protein